MKIAVVSSSLNPQSRSRRLAQTVAESFGEVDDVEIDFIQLSEVELPLCDGGAAYGHSSVAEIGARLGAADAIIIATPVYNYTVNAALKNMTELVGRQMAGKLIGFLVSAGGAMSYMSIMQYANSLMLDFRCLILPRFVYAIGEDWLDGELSPKLQDRLDQFETDFLTLARKITG